MDLVLEFLNPIVFDPLFRLLRSSISANVCPAINWNSHSFFYSKIIRYIPEIICAASADSGLWQRENIYRQSISIFVLIWLFSACFYLTFGTICYYWHFDRSLKAHPKFKRNQIRREIEDSLYCLLLLCTLTVPIFILQMHPNNYSRLYKFGTASWVYEAAQYPLFIIFSDTCMYWLHRWFHHPVLFKRMHKKHHKYMIPTPFSAYSFDPLEGWIMSLPVYAYSFIWPMSDYAQLVVFCLSNIWSFLLHDSREQFHTVHHKHTNFNFGQFTSFWDILGGTYKDPAFEMNACYILKAELH